MRRLAENQEFVRSDASSHDVLVHGVASFHDDVAGYSISL
jgi:hypothetical protein